MITIFAIPKPFHGHTAVIQSNAIRSWARLEGADVLLIGDDEGVAGAARAVGATHISQVAKSSHGTPLVSSAFHLARSASRQTLLAYSNADIIFFPAFVNALAVLPRRDFLLVGQRSNVDLRIPIQFDDPGWEQSLRAQVAEAGDVSDPTWIDYFVMPRDSALTSEMPPFVVGRPKWDNWLMRRARELQVPLIDGTNFITAVHQRHDYSHVPSGTGNVWEGPEATINRELYARITKYNYGIEHATHVLTRRGPMPALGMKYVKQRWRTRHDMDGIIERVGRCVDPALVPARWVYHIGRSRR